jgi:hypothetical protein
MLEGRTQCKGGHRFLMLWEVVDLNGAGVTCDMCTCSLLAVADSSVPCVA